MKVMPCIERVQLRFIKYVHGVKDCTSSVVIYGEVGRYRFYINHISYLIRYWRHLVNLSDDHLAKKSCNMLRQLSDLGFKNWTIKSLRIY